MPGLTVRYPPLEFCGWDVKGCCESNLCCIKRGGGKGGITMACRRAAHTVQRGFVELTGTAAGALADGALLACSKC